MVSSWFSSSLICALFMLKLSHLSLTCPPPGYVTCATAFHYCFFPLIEINENCLDRCPCQIITNWCCQSIAQLLCDSPRSFRFVQWPGAERFPSRLNHAI